MAQLLIRDVDNIQKGAVKDRQGSYKKGDVIVVMGDSHIWGKKEGLPNFRIESVSGLASEYEYLTVFDDQPIMPKFKNPTQRVKALREAEIKPMRRRRYKFTTQPELKRSCLKL